MDDVKSGSSPTYSPNAKTGYGVPVFKAKKYGVMSVTHVLPVFLYRLSLVIAFLPGIVQGQPTDLFEPLLERAEELDPLNSLIIQHRGEIVAEKYYRGMKADRSVNMKSVSKTLLSPLIGIAIRDSLIEGPHQNLSALLPEYFAEIEDAHRRKISLHHVLSMTTGLEGTSFGNYGAWVNSADWVKHALNRPVVCEIATCMTYSTGNTHLLSVILSNVSQKDLRAYARETFYGKLGIPLYKWDQDPQGNYMGGNNMALRPRDMLRFAEVFLNEGRYNGEQLVPSAWIEASWKARTVSPWNGHQYGYLWWSRTFSGALTHFAWGYGGQYIFIVPQFELIVIVTSSLTNRPRGVNHNEAILEFLAQDIIPAISAVYIDVDIGPE